jgi:signal transduction histidine kinase
VEPTSFADALGELLDDAVRATRRGHPVVVDVHETHEGAVLWQIQDVGEGYPEQGSGVALARVVAERHGGILRVESAPGVGTTVSVWLPGH